MPLAERNVGIQSVAAATPLGGVDAVWNAWLSGQGGVVGLEYTPERWQADGMEVLRRVVDGAAVAERAWTGLILATTKGDMEGGGGQVAWMRAADGLHRADAPAVPPTLGGAAQRLAHAARLGGPAYAVSTACASGLTALIDGAVCVLQGDARAMAIIGMDFAGDFVHEGFHALHALSAAGVCRPFDRERDGLVLGSAAAGCLVTSEAARRGGCVISGWGVASDAVHMTAPDRDASGLIRAIQEAMLMAGVAPRDVDVYFAHGTGTRYNDAMEAVALEAVFRRSSGEKGPAITAVKGLIGHTLGASGLIEAALAVRMMERQAVPAITGLAAPEWAALDLVRAARRMPVRHVLKVASGFGGLNAAIIFSRGEGAV